MDDIATIAALRTRLDADRAAGRRIGFVPTMGFLHEGHLRLVDAARAANDVVVLSVFVNPLQFAPGEDFERYPRNIDRDRTLAQARGVDVVFAPPREEMYPEPIELRVMAGSTASLWEGAVRPGHFDGVLTVVAKLLNIVEPDVAYFGQKDIQQVTLVRAMVRDLNMRTALHVMPTVRETDGLAMSSRNVYLTPPQRSAARALSQSLQAIVVAWRNGEHNTAALIERAQSLVAAEPLVTPDYIAVVEPQRLHATDRAERGNIAMIAARVGTTRLIDNMILDE